MDDITAVQREADLNTQNFQMVSIKNNDSESFNVDISKLTIINKNRRNFFEQHLNVLL